MSEELREQIEEILSNGIWNGEEVDITTDKVMKILKSKLKEALEEVERSISELQVQPRFKNHIQEAINKLKP